MAKRRRKLSAFLDAEAVTDGSIAEVSEDARRNMASSSTRELAVSSPYSSSSSSHSGAGALALPTASLSDSASSQGASGSGRLRRLTSRVSSVFSKLGSPRKRQRVDSLAEDPLNSNRSANHLGSSSTENPERILEMRSIAQAPASADADTASSPGSQSLPRPALRPAPSVREIAKLFKDDDATAAEEKSVHFPSGLTDTGESGGSSPLYSREDEGELSYIDEQEIEEVEMSLLQAEPEGEEEEESAAVDELVNSDEHQIRKEDSRDDEVASVEGSEEGQEMDDPGVQDELKDHVHDASDDANSEAQHDVESELRAQHSEALDEEAVQRTTIAAEQESFDSSNPLSSSSTVPKGEEESRATAEVAHVGGSVAEAAAEVVSPLRAQGTAFETLQDFTSTPSEVLPPSSATAEFAAGGGRVTNGFPTSPSTSAVPNETSMPVPAKLVSALSPHTRSPRFNKARSRIPQATGSPLAGSVVPLSAQAFHAASEDFSSKEKPDTSPSAVGSPVDVESSAASGVKVNGAPYADQAESDSVATLAAATLYPDLSRDGSIGTDANRHEAHRPGSQLYPNLSGAISAREQDEAREPLDLRVSTSATGDSKLGNSSSDAVPSHARNGQEADEEEREEGEAEEEDESILIPRLPSVSSPAQHVRRTSSLRTLSESASKTLASWAGRASQVASEAIADAIDAAGVPTEEGELSVILRGVEDRPVDPEPTTTHKSNDESDSAEISDDKDDLRVNSRLKEGDGQGNASAAVVHHQDELPSPATRPAVPPLDEQHSPRRHSNEENMFDLTLHGGAAETIDLTGSSGDELVLPPPVARPGLPRKASLIPRPALTEMQAPTLRSREPRRSSGHIPRGPAPRRQQLEPGDMGRSASVLSGGRENDLDLPRSAIATIRRLGSPAVTPRRSGSSPRAAAVPRKSGAYRNGKKDPIGMNEHLVRQAAQKRLRLSRQVNMLQSLFQIHTQLTADQVQKRLELQLRTEHAADVEKRGRALADTVLKEERLLQVLQRDLERVTRAQRSRLQPSRSEQKTLSRLKAEEKLREKRLRGILGRQPMPDRLDDQQERDVRHILSDATFEKQIPGAIVNNRNLQRLKPGQWLDDESINFYAVLINNRSNDMRELRASRRAAQKNLAIEAPRVDVEARKALEADRKRAKKAQGYWDVHAFQTHMFVKIQREGHAGVKRWTKKVDVFSKDRLIFPVNRSNSHWVTAAIDLRHRRFEFYDSMSGGWAQEAARALRHWLEAEWLAKKATSFDGRKLDTSGWYVYDCPTNPQQENGSDCGVFTVLMMEHLSRRDPWEAFPTPPALDLVQMLDASDEEASRGREADLDEDLHELEWNFAQENVPYYRRRMIWELGNATLLE